MKKRYVTIIAIIAATLVLSILFIFINIKITSSVNYVEVELNGEVEYPDIGASFFDNDLSNRIVLYDDVDTSIVGSQELEYIVDFLFVKKSVSIEVEVKDVKPPIIKLDYGNLVVWELGKEFDTFGYSVTDDYYKDIKTEVDDSKIDVQNEGVYSVRYVAEDGSGNIAVKHQEVIVSREINQTMFLENEFDLRYKLENKADSLTFDQLYQYYFVGDSIIRDMGYNMRLQPERVIANPCLSPSNFEKNECTYESIEKNVSVDQLIDRMVPKKIVINIGLCDIEQGGFVRFFSEYVRIINRISSKYPDMEIVIASVLPVASDELETKPTNSVINIYNYYLSLLAKENGLDFVNVAEVLKDESGIGKKEYYKNDQYHLTDIGEEVYINYMKEYLRK